MPEKHLSNWYTAPTIGNPDLGTLLEILYGSLDQCFRSGWTIDIDRHCAIEVPYLGQKKTETTSVIVVVMSNEYGSDFSHVHGSFCDAARYPVAGVHNVVDAIDDQQISTIAPDAPPGPGRRECRE